MIVPGSYGDDVGQTAYLHRRDSDGGGPVSELPVIVAPPGPDGTIRFQSDGMRHPACQCDHACDPFHPHGENAARHRAVTELAAAVPPPGPDAAVSEQGQGMPFAGSDCNDPGEAVNLDGHMLGHRAVADLAVVVVPPCPDRAVVSQCQRVGTTGRD